VVQTNGILLSPSQQEIVDFRGGHLQVIACAGSGKTESISRRVASLIADDILPESIVAFTFTEKAATELKDRIYRRVGEIKGDEFLGRIGPMYVGTIHGYCFRLLQDNVPQYGNYDVLDEHRHAALISRRRHEIGIDKLEHRHWKSIELFLKSADVIENESIHISDLEGEEIGECYSKYCYMLDRFRFLTFGMIISKAVNVLQSNPEVYAKIHGRLRHLIVDEYQDINPAQEKLIALLSCDPVELCVVGDDDQAIYQWRGSDVGNIIKFSERYGIAKVIKLESNRRSRPAIVECANEFAQTISNRLDKAMKPIRSDASPSLFVWTAEDPSSEADIIADHMIKLHKDGWKYRDMSALFRSVRTSAPIFVNALDERNIPYNCGGRTGLFAHPEINCFGELFAWMAEFSWRDERFGPSRNPDLNRLVEGLSAFFEVPLKGRKHLVKYFKDWKSFHTKSNRRVSLVGDFYQHLDTLGLSQIDPDSPKGSARIGAFARFSKVLADYENVTLRSRWKIMPDGTSVYRSGKDRGKPFWTGLANYLVHYAKDSYEDFEGEEIHDLDAVSILTVHQAKGLEWPIVFLPSLSNRRFPSSMSGKRQKWPFPEGVFPDEKRIRYEGTDGDERRLFYVALSRAREIIYASSFRRLKRKVLPSPYLHEIADSLDIEPIPIADKLPLLPKNEDQNNGELFPLELGFSDLADYEGCGYGYRLSRVFGFERELVTELGYGRAIHHILRHVAENSYKDGHLPTAKELEMLLDKELYVPFANEATFRNMRRNVRNLVDRYIADWSDDLERIWETERPFEIHMQEGILSGRADVILDHEEGRADHLAIVDYKTATDEYRDERYALQLTIYALAGRQEGLHINACYLHELKNSNRKSVDVSQEKTLNALNWASLKVKEIRSGVYDPIASKEKCDRCDFNRVCKHCRTEF